MQSKLLVVLDHHCRMNVWQRLCEPTYYLSGKYWVTPNIQSHTPIALCFTVVGTAAQRAQTTTAVSSGNSGFGQHVLGAASLSLGTVMGPVAPISQPGEAQVPRPALAPNHAIQPSLLSQRLVLTSQAQARLPSKWPPLLSISPPLMAQQNTLLLRGMYMGHC